MNFSLTPGLERFVRDLAGSGDYNNASEVVREALRLLKRTGEERALKMQRLRAAIQEGGGAPMGGGGTEPDGERDARPFETGRRRLSKDTVLAILRRQEPDLRRQGITALHLIGSVTHGAAGPDSDIDIVLDIDPAATFDMMDLLGVRLQLTELFQRDVNVLIRGGIDGKISKQVMAEAERVF